MDKKSKTWIIIGVVLILLMIGVAVYASVGKSDVIATPNSTPVPQPTSTNPLDFIKNIINIFKGKNSSSPVVCDPNKPGYDINGFPNSDCGFGL